MWMSGSLLCADRIKGRRCRSSASSRFEMWSSFVSLGPLVVLCLVASSAPGDAVICTSALCEYELVITRGSTMTYTTDAATYNVVMDGSDLRVAPNSYRLAGAPPIGDIVPASEVNTADGFSRNMFLINGQFPGPAIEVTYGVQVMNYNNRAFLF